MRFLYFERLPDNTERYLCPACAVKTTTSGIRAIIALEVERLFKSYPYCDTCVGPLWSDVPRRDDAASRS